MTGQFISPSSARVSNRVRVRVGVSYMVRNRDKWYLWLCSS